jgi:hypothetical protein
MKRYFITLLALLTLAVTGSVAQVLPNVESNFTTYTSATLQEKLYVHTDKSGYTAGEPIWFKVYNVDGILMKPLTLSKVVYVEVLDARQNAVLQTKIAMKDGTGNGSFYIPVNLATGNFVLRAYTSWMKNFGADYYFSKKISIINPLKSPESEYKAVAAAYDVQFFPEGGNLVAGLSSTVGIKAADQWGKSVSFKGAILNAKNDTLVRFTPLKFGIGHFSFKPESGVAYHAVMNIDGKIVQKELPAINPNGYVMGLKDNGTQITVNVSTNVASQNIYLFAQTRNVIKQVLSAKVNGGVATFTLDKSKLGEGISQLTVFNADKKPVCERLYFKRPTKNMTIDASSSAAMYTTRKKVDVAIGTRDNGGKPVAANLSMAVYKLDSLQVDHQENIMSYLWLRADLKGNIEQPNYYFKNTGAGVDEALDNLMITQGWRSFAWDDVVQGKSPVFNFLPEFNGPIITAKITNQQNSQPANGIVAYLGIPGKSVQLYAAKSDARGRLNFSLKNYFGIAEIVAQTNTEIDINYHIEILTPFSEQFAKTPVPAFAVSPALQSAFDEQTIAMQVQNIYNGPKMRLFNPARTDSSAFYGVPFKTYPLDSYTRFTTMEEVMREFIREVNVFHTNNKFRMKIINGVIFLSDDNPMVLVDGVPFFDMNKVFAIDPLKIRKIETVPSNYSLGDSYEKGIVSITSYKGDLGGAEIDPHAVVLDYEGLQQERRFYSPAYDTEEQVASHLPDFRNVLYWSPSVTTGANGKSQVSFYTSDQPGKYVGVIQGITGNGEAGSQSFTFEVRPGFSTQVK